jgi:hypothetical protein
VTQHAVRTVVLRALLGAILLAALLPATAGASTRVSGTPLQLLHRLATASEHHAGYDRDLFPTWIDADHDGCDTRDEVLIAESRAPVRLGSGCAIHGGRWFSAYDGRWTTKPSTFDIDHLVPLKEAWESGAWRWSAGRRRAYANDLGSSRTLRAVSASSNRSKGDGDPAQWLPPRVSFRCTYARQWVATKVRWHLSVNPAERRALHDILSACPAPIVTVQVA